MGAYGPTKNTLKHLQKGRVKAKNPGLRVRIHLYTPLAKPAQGGNFRKYSHAMSDDREHATPGSILNAQTLLDNRGSDDGHQWRVQFQA